MHFFKLAFLTVFVACCMSFASAQLYQYKQLTDSDLKKMCQQNKVNLTELENLQEGIDNLLFESITPTKNPDELKKKPNCLGNTLQIRIQRQMNIVRKCLQGNITLDDGTVHSLIQESEKKLCALSRLASYEEYLKDSGCLKSQNVDNCEMAILNSNKMQNSYSFANLGLSYSEEGRKKWVELFECATKATNNKCDKLKKVKLEQVTNEFVDTMKVTPRIRRTMKLTPQQVQLLNSTA